MFAIYILNVSINTVFQQQNIFFKLNISKFLFGFMYKVWKLIGVQTAQMLSVVYNKIFTMKILLNPVCYKLIQSQSQK